MKAVAYIRVSQEGEHPENQKHAIQRYAKSKGIEVVRYFVDVGTSGASEVLTRPVFRKLLQYCKQKGIFTIVMYDLTRLSRNVEDGLLTLKHLTDENYIVLFAEGDFMGAITDPMLRKKVIMDYLWFAEFYREDIRRRTKAGLERAKAEGKRVGRPPLSEETRRAIVELHNRGLPKAHIARALKVSRTTVYRVLKGDVKK